MRGKRGGLTGIQHARKNAHLFWLILDYFPDLSCWTGPLRVGRSLRDVCTPSAGPPDGRVGYSLGWEGFEGGFGFVALHSHFGGLLLQAIDDVGGGFGDERLISKAAF